MKAELKELIGSLPKNAIRRIGEFLFKYILKIELMETEIETLKQEIKDLQIEIGILKDVNNI